MTSTRISSSGGAMSLILDYVGEVRFGPAYYSLTAQGFSLPLSDSALATEAAWTPDERGIAIVALHSTDASRPPDCDLIFVHIASQAAHTLARENALIEIRSISDVGCDVSIGDLPREIVWPA